MACACRRHAFDRILISLRVDRGEEVTSRPLRAKTRTLYRRAVAGVNLPFNWGPNRVAPAARNRLVESIFAAQSADVKDEIG